MSDPYKLERFVEAQRDSYAAAQRELRAGKKRSHWMWFVFPQIAGLGVSDTARFYAIASIDEARAYLAHPVLGARLRECCALLLAVEQGRSALDVLGWPDDLKLRSSMTLFERAAPDEALFSRVLARYYEGKRDEATLARL